MLVGGVPEESPYYILLYHNNDEKNGIDIRTEDVEAFLYGGIQGDVNADGVFSVADVILLQKWLLTVPDTHLANWKAADFCEDGKLDVFDLCLMKRAVIGDHKNKAKPMLVTIYEGYSWIEQQTVKVYDQYGNLYIFYGLHEVLEAKHIALLQEAIAYRYQVLVDRGIIV